MASCPEDGPRRAIVIGVGPRHGLGGELCARFAAAGHHVFIAARTQHKIDALAAELNAADGRYRQPARSWTFEVDLRPSVENW